MQGQYVIAGCAEGGLHVWIWETNAEICHIPAHKQRIHHCSLLINTGKLLYNIAQCNESPSLIFIFYFLFILALVLRQERRSQPRRNDCYHCI